jgi:hypothetical protein
MASAQSATSASIARPPRSGFGGLVAWCYDHRRRVLVGWRLAGVAIIGLAAAAVELRIPGSRITRSVCRASHGGKPLAWLSGRR